MTETLDKGPIQNLFDANRIGKKPLVVKYDEWSTDSEYQKLLDEEDIDKGKWSTLSGFLNILYKYKDFTEKTKRTYYDLIDKAVSSISEHKDLFILLLQMRHYISFRLKQMAEYELGYEFDKDLNDNCPAKFRNEHAPEYFYSFIDMYGYDGYDGYFEEQKELMCMLDNIEEALKKYGFY
jgi:hypothetical protein